MDGGFRADDDDDDRTAQEGLLLRVKKSLCSSRGEKEIERGESPSWCNPHTQIQLLDRPKLHLPRRSNAKEGRRRGENFQKSFCSSCSSRRRRCLRNKCLIVSRGVDMIDVARAINGVHCVVTPFCPLLFLSSPVSGFVCGRRGER